MSYMRRSLPTRIKKLVNGLARPTPAWLKAMEHGLCEEWWHFLVVRAPPGRPNGRMEKIESPLDAYMKRFYEANRDSAPRGQIKISWSDPSPARDFAWRVLQLTVQGVSEDVAMARANREYLYEKSEQRRAYKEQEKHARREDRKLSRYSR